MAGLSQLRAFRILVKHGDPPAPQVDDTAVSSKAHRCLLKMGRANDLTANRLTNTGTAAILHSCSLLAYLTAYRRMTDFRGTNHLC
jgi:hypothetical protein